MLIQTSKQEHLITLEEALSKTRQNNLLLGNGYDLEALTKTMLCPFGNMLNRQVYELGNPILTELNTSCIHNAIQLKWPNLLPSRACQCRPQGGHQIPGQSSGGRPRQGGKRVGRHGLQGQGHPKGRGYVPPRRPAGQCRVHEESGRHLQRWPSLGQGPHPSFGVVPYGQEDRVQIR